MKRRILSLFLAVAMIVCMLPAAIYAADDILLTGTIFNQKTATWDYYKGNGLKPEYAFDGDESTFWLCGGTDLAVGTDQYIGMNYGTAVDITSVYVLLNAEPEGCNAATWLQVSEDGSAWVNAYELTGTTTATVAYENFSDEAKAVTVKQLRVWRTMDATYTESGEKVWHNFRAYEIQAYGSYIAPADDSFAGVFYDQPISTTFGTTASMIPEAYTVQTEGLEGITFILKVEGIPEGESAILEGVELSVTSGETTPSSAWSGTWVSSTGNYNTFAEDGYYAYSVPFKLLDDGGSLQSVAAGATINGLTFFQTGCAFNWAMGNKTNDTTIDENISISVLGIVEGDIPARFVALYDAEGVLLGKGVTSTDIDISAKKTYWSKLTEPADIYDGDANAPLGKGLDYFADAKGNRVDYILGESTLNAVYKDVDVASYTIALPELTPGTKGDAAVTLSAVEGDADGAVAPVSGTVTITFDGSAYSVNGETDGSVTVAYDAVGENGVVATVSVAALDLAATGDYTFTVGGTAVTDLGEATIIETTAAGSLTSNQSANGSFFTGDVVPFNKTTTTVTTETTTDADGNEVVTETVTEKAPSQQVLWNGNVNFGEESIGGTFVVKVDGIETPITADRFIIVAQDTLMAGHWSTGCGNWVNAPAVYQLTFEKDGYYYINVNYSAMDGRKIIALEQFVVFNNNKGVNKNENATFQMLGVVQNDLKPTVKFVNPDGTEIVSYTHAYTNVTGWSQQTRIGELIGAEEMFALSGAAAPTYEPGDGKVYYFDGWTDAAGNPVDAIYADMTIYANYTTDTVTYVGTATDVEFGGNKTTVSIELSEDSVPVTSGSVTLTFDENVFSHKDAKDGVLTLDWPVITEDVPAEGETEDVPAEGESEEEVVDPTILTVDLGVTTFITTGTYDITLSGTAVAEDGDDELVLDSTVSVNVTGLEIEGEIINPDSDTWVTLPTDGNLKETLIWDGYADFTGAGGITFVYRATGVETPIEAGIARAPYYTADDSTHKSMTDEWAYTNGWTSSAAGDGDFALRVYIPEDGYYFMYLSCKVLGMTHNGSGLIGAADAFYVFSKGATTVKEITPTNTNTDAKMQMLAVVADNLQPTVNFYNGDELVVAQQHKYSNTTNATKVMGDTPVNVNHYVKGQLVTVADIFAESAVAAPTKAAEADGTEYFFTGWVDKYGNPVDDISVYTDQNVYAAYTTTAVDYTATAADVELSGTTTDVTVKIEDNSLGIVSGTVSVEFDPDVFSHADADDGVLTVTYNEVAEDGTIAVITLGVDPLAVKGDYTLTVSGTSTDVLGNGVFVKTSTATVAIDGHQTGAYITQDPQPLNKTGEDGSNPASQDLWTGEVDLRGTDGKAASGVTFVYKLDGIDTPVDAGMWDMYYIGEKSDGSISGKQDLDWSNWFWNYNGTTGTPQSTDWQGDGVGHLVFEADGYYYLYIPKSKTPNQWYYFDSVYRFSINRSHTASNCDDFVTPSNTNEAATFQMLGIFSDALAPTVQFYDGDLLLTSTVYTYTTQNTKYIGSLVDPATVFAATGLEAPSKAADDQYVYEFAGWVDADGNEVDVVYRSQKLYAKYNEIEKTQAYDVTFMNEGKAYATQSVYYKDVPVTPEGTPTKADSDTGTYTFAGWSLTEGGEIVDVTTVQITKATTFYAVYTYEDVTFTVTYVSDGKTVYTETVVRSQAAVYDGIPTMPTDEYIEGFGGFYHVFEAWTVEHIDENNGVTMVPADLTNIRGDITVYAQFEDVLVENWYTVTWLDYDGSVLDSDIIAEGDDASTKATGALNGTASETTWYTFNGWDVKTTDVSADITANIVYTETAVATGDNVVIASGSGTVGTQNDLVTSDNAYTYTTQSDFMTLIFDIKGASEENPISIGAIRTRLINGGTEIDSNYSGNYSANQTGVRAATVDGKYYVTINLGVLTWVGSSYEIIKTLSIDDAGSTRGGKSSGEGTYDVTVIEGKLEPTVRFYDEEGNWLYTGKTTAGSWYDFAAVPTVDDIYAGPAIADFEAWVDADSNPVTYVTANMSVYAKVTHVCDFVATGAGTAECTCGAEKTDAFTIIADENVEVTEMKAGETVKVPVIVNNGAFVGATLTVTTSDNVTVTDIDATGTPFEGNIAEYVDKIVLNAATDGANITADGTIVYLELTANADIAAEETITVEINAIQVVDIANTDITADVADGYVATYTATAPEAEVILWGDVTGDGKIDGTDAMYLNRYASGWAKADYAAATKLMELGDITGEGNVDGTDAMYLNRYASGWAKADYEAAGRLIESLNYLESIKAE